MVYYSLVFSLSLSHYFVNGGFFSSNNQLLNNVDIIRHIPCTIIQGRYDVVTPFKTAWELHKVNSLSHTHTHTHTHTHRTLISTLTPTL